MAWEDCKRSRRKKYRSRMISKYIVSTGKGAHFALRYRKGWIEICGKRGVQNWARRILDDGWEMHYEKPIHILRFKAAQRFWFRVKCSETGWKRGLKTIGTLYGLTPTREFGRIVR